MRRDGGAKLRFLRRGVAMLVGDYPLERAMSDEKERVYPRDYVPRIFGAVAALCVGWELWWWSMGAPGSGVHGAHLWFVAIILFSGLCAPAMPFMGGGVASVPIAFLLFAHFLSVFGGWLPVVFRLRAREVWFWRIVSLGFLLPLFLVANPTPRALFTPGSGGMMWAIGSGVLALAVWLSPKRVEGEPEFAVTVLWRALRGERVLEEVDGVRLPRAGRAFPVEVEEKRGE